MGEYLKDAKTPSRTRKRTRRPVARLSHGREQRLRRRRMDEIIARYCSDTDTWASVRVERESLSNLDDRASRQATALYAWRVPSTSEEALRVLSHRRGLAGRAYSSAW